MDVHAIERHGQALAKRLLERCECRRQDQPGVGTGRPAGGGLKLLEERGRVGHDLDVVGPVHAKYDRHTRRADLVRTSDRPAEHDDRGDATTPLR